ncbi:MAG TPA: hypothetical protein VFU76_06680, partial [Terriglobales bacterium]|nr:hypothetical protein [Terriglobales bacterium]
GSNGVGTLVALSPSKGGSANTEINIYSDPYAVWSNFRNPILGLDNFRSTYNGMRGLPYWNMDLSVRKNIRVAERFSLEAQMMFQNVFNHIVFNDPSMETDSAKPWGTLRSQRNGPRTMEFGIRVSF